MSNLIRVPSSNQLTELGVDPTSRIHYWDGKLMIVSDPAQQEGSFMGTAKAFTAVLCAVGLFTVAPTVSLVMVAYAICKGKSALASIYDPHFVESDEVPRRKAIGAAAKFGAVEVEGKPFESQYEESIEQYIERVPAARPVESDIQSAQSANFANNPWDKPQAQPMNPVATLGNQLSSLLVIAPTGAGKGILISNLTRHFYQQHSELRIYAFEGKNDPNETGYWAEGFTSVVRINLDTCAPAVAASAILHLIGLVDTAQGSSPSILLIDEANALIMVLENGYKYGDKEDKVICGQALGTVKKKISTSASTGNSAQKYVWVIGQNPNLSALGLNGGDANQLRKVAISLFSNPLLTDQIVLSTSFTGKPQDANYRTKINDLIEASPIDRAFYDSALAQTTNDRGWFPMAEMPNYSGYNRDSRKQINAPNSVGLPQSKILSGHGSSSATSMSASAKKVEAILPKPEIDHDEAIAEQRMLLENPQRVVKRKPTYEDLIKDSMVEAADFIRDQQNHIDNNGAVKVRDFVQGTSSKELRAVRGRAIDYLLSYYPESFTSCDEVVKGQMSRRVKAIS